MITMGRSLRRGRAVAGGSWPLGNRCEALTGLYMAVIELPARDTATAIRVLEGGDRRRCAWTMRRQPYCALLAYSVEKLWRIPERPQRRHFLKGFRPKKSQNCAPVAHFSLRLRGYRVFQRNRPEADRVNDSDMVSSDRRR